MPRNDFALDGPRRISICIPGYDGQAMTREQRRKRQERSARLARRDKRQQGATASAANAAVQPGEGVAAANPELETSGGHASQQAFSFETAAGSTPAAPAPDASSQE
jgi:hypothetical protein